MKIGKKKYYYTLEVIAYDKNKNVVTKTSKDVKKEKTDISISVNSSVAYLDLNVYSRTDKYLMKTAKYNVLTGVEVKIDNLTATFPDANLRACIKNEIGSSTITDGQIMNLTWLSCGGRGITKQKIKVGNNKNIRIM